MQAIVRLLDRLVPTLLLACSVGLLTAGLLLYAPSAFGEWRTPQPSLGGGNPLFGAASSSPAGTGASPLPDGPPGTPFDLTPTPTPGPVPSGVAARAHATRIVIPAQDIDLPVVAGDLELPGNVGNYPLCDVAMYLTQYAQPGETGTTYIYAHAQHGMFAPLLKASETDQGAVLVGALVEVYTSADRLYLYQISVVKQHATDLSITDIAAGQQQLVLQTSEGVAGTIPKLQLAAQLIGIVPAGHGDANPAAHPRVCLPAS